MILLYLKSAAVKVTTVWKPCSNEPKNIEEQVSDEEIDIEDSDVENEL